MMKKMPYFDLLLAILGKDQAIDKSFGRHVHWGYWGSPEKALLTADDFAEATERLSKLLISLANIKDGLAVLDVGCGFGGTVASLNETYNGMQLVGLNIDERQLHRARQNVHAKNGNSVEFKQGDACALPFADGIFDVVLAVECIFHFPSREQFFKEAQRVLKPDGYLVLSDFITRGYLPWLLPKQINSGFFGTCNVKFTQQQYHVLAQQTRFTICAEKNITRHTLPTYRYLKSLLVQNSKYRALTFMAVFAVTAVIEILARSRLLNYFVFSFKKIP